MGAARSAEATDFMQGVVPITRVTLHDEVLTRLRDMIIDGSLPPGSRINEVQTGALLGVSRTPLREAIKTLASEGLVEILPARGAVVRRFGERDVFDILQVLKSLEQTAARLLCAQASDEELAGLSALHEEMMESTGAGIGSPISNVISGSTAASSGDRGIRCWPRRTSSCSPASSACASSAMTGRTAGWVRWPSTRRCAGPGRRGTGSVSLPCSASISTGRWTG